MSPTMSCNLRATQAPTKLYAVAAATSWCQSFLFRMNKELKKALSRKALLVMLLSSQGREGKGDAPTELSRAAALHKEYLVVIWDIKTGGQIGFSLIDYIAS